MLRCIIPNMWLLQETWDISALDAIISLFFKDFGAPPAPPVAELS